MYLLLKRVYIVPACTCYATAHGSLLTVCLHPQEAERVVLASLQQHRASKLQAEPTLRCRTPPPFAAAAAAAPAADTASCSSCFCNCCYVLRLLPQLPPCRVVLLLMCLRALSCTVLPLRYADTDADTFVTRLKLLIALGYS